MRSLMDGSLRQGRATCQISAGELAAAHGLDTGCAKPKVSSNARIPKETDHADCWDGPFHHPHHQRLGDVAFYQDILGFTPGPRPAFSFPGAWLYNDGRAILHVAEGRPSRRAAGCSIISRSRGWMRRRMSPSSKRAGSYDLRRLPQSGHAGGVWQLFFFDPSGARVEIDFAASESAEL